MKYSSLLPKEKKNLRNPNIDLLRIVGMYIIIIHHLILHGKANIKFNKYNNQIHLLNIFCMWHVSSFGIISGMVGYKNHKFSNLFYLWIVVLFYSLLFHIKFRKIIQLEMIYKFSCILFPAIYKLYWYFTAYFGIYPFLPFINSGINNMNQVDLKKSIYFIIGIFIIWASYHRDSFSQNGGYTTFSLLIFYIFGAYIGKFIFFRKENLIHRVMTCIICIFIFIKISLISYNINIKENYSKLDINFKNLFKIRINSLPMFLQVISITLFIAQIKLNKIISSIITFLGPLTFDIYLIHENPYIKTIYIRNIFNKDNDDLNIYGIYSLIFKKSFYIFFIGICISYIRSVFFRFIRIKLFCNKCETIITKILIHFL